MSFLSAMTAEFFPFEHPTAYWLRAGAQGLLCTRCGKAEPASIAEGDGAEAFVALHLACPLGFGLRASKPGGPRLAPTRPQDPIFA